MIPTPFVSLRSTFPPDRGNRPHRPAGGHMGPPLRRRKLHIPRFRLRRKLTHSAAPTLPTEPAAVAAGLRRGPHNSPPCERGVADRGDSVDRKRDRSPPHPAQCTHWATFPPQGGRLGRRAEVVAPNADSPSSKNSPFSIPNSSFILHSAFLHSAFLSPISTLHSQLSTLRSHFAPYFSR